MPRLFFSEKEIAYLRTQRLAQIATVSTDLQPDVAPVSFEFDGEYFYTGSMMMARTFRYKNIIRGNIKVAFVVGDLKSVDPWKPRAIKIHGSADLVTRKGLAGSGAYIRITPEVKWSLGIDEPAFKDGQPVIRKTTK
jgi:pyridoxamine 5'-phosphate oxidase family protein